ncbi:ATP-dependent zinc metalloprotease FtsH [Patescibacteria group bacterium]|nr:ATP-dependent zinc metalloprotease FtsH [Patescibacteria group bacterium]
MNKKNKKNIKKDDKKNILKNFLIYFFVFLIIGALLSFGNLETQSSSKVGIKDFVDFIDNNNVKEIVVSGDRVNFITNNNEEKYFYKEEQESLNEIFATYGISKENLNSVNIEVNNLSNRNFIFNILLPILLPLLLFFLFFMYLSKKLSGAGNKTLSFGQSNLKQINNDSKKTTFNDVAGNLNAKDELTEIVDFLKNPKKYTSIGAKIPHGVLLIGSPGTGKTLLAKAVSGEAGVPFFTISGSEFVEMFVGVGASRVRDVFDKAKKQSPCIVFIDEIDAVGRQRGVGVSGSHEEREQTLNQILVEMDGFGTDINIIIIAATNRPDVLDKALLRPGRFDRVVVLDSPDIKDRTEILKIHAKNKPIAKDVNFKLVAERTPGFSGADLENLLNESAILTASKNKKEIVLQDILNSIEKVLLGPEKKSHILSKEEKKITAYHEAGHAIVANFLENCDPVHKISIVSRGRAAGYTLNLPEKEIYLHSKDYYIDTIAMMLGGYIVEKELLKKLSSGPSSDLKKATELAKKLITEFAMGEDLPVRVYGEKDELFFLGNNTVKVDYSEETAKMVDKEIANIIEDAYNRAKTVILKNKKALDKVVDILIEKETIEKDEFKKIIENVI